MVANKLSGQELALIDLLVGMEKIYSDKRLTVELQFTRQSIKWIEQVGIKILKVFPIAEQGDVVMIYLSKHEYIKYLNLCCSHFGFTVYTDGSTYTHDNRLVIDSNNNRVL